MSRLLKLLWFSRFSVSPGNKQIAQLGLVDENRQGHFQSKGGKERRGEMERLLASKFTRVEAA